MIPAIEAACRAMRQALDAAVDDLDAALVDATDIDDIRLRSAIERVDALERQLMALEWRT